MLVIWLLLAFSGVKGRVVRVVYKHPVNYAYHTLPQGEAEQQLPMNQTKQQELHYAVEQDDHKPTLGAYAPPEELSTGFNPPTFQHNQYKIPYAHSTKHDSQKVVKVPSVIPKPDKTYVAPPPPTLPPPPSALPVFPLESPTKVKIVLTRWPMEPILIEYDHQKHEALPLTEYGLPQEEYSSGHIDVGESQVLVPPNPPITEASVNKHKEPLAHIQTLNEYDLSPPNNKMPYLTPTMLQPFRLSHTSHEQLAPMTFFLNPQQVFPGLLPSASPFSLLPAKNKESNYITPPPPPELVHPQTQPNPASEYVFNPPEPSAHAFVPLPSKQSVKNAGSPLEPVPTPEYVPPPPEPALEDAILPSKPDSENVLSTFCTPAVPDPDYATPPKSETEYALPPIKLTSEYELVLPVPENSVPLPDPAPEFAVLAQPESENSVPPLNPEPEYALPPSLTLPSEEFVPPPPQSAPDYSLPPLKLVPEHELPPPPLQSEVPSPEYAPPLQKPPSKYSLFPLKTVPQYAPPPPVSASDHSIPPPISSAEHAPVSKPASEYAPPPPLLPAVAPPSRDSPSQNGEHKHQQTSPLSVYGLPALVLNYFN